MPTNLSYVPRYMISQGRARRSVSIRHVVVAIYSATLYATPLLAQGSLDVVHRKEGASVRGIIKNMDANQLTVDVRGTPQVVPVHDVRQVVFGQEPSQLRRVRELIENGQLENALDSLSRVDGSRVRRDEVKKEVEYLRLHCRARLALASGKDIRSVVPGLIAFVKSGTDNYRYYEAVSLLGDLALAMGRNSVAAKYYGELQKSSSPELRLNGLLKQADALLAEGDFSGAADTYNSALSVGVSSTAANRTKTLAQIGVARCQAEKGQAKAAIPVLEKIIDGTNPEDVETFAKAYNALGAAYRNDSQIPDAILAYLHTDLLFHRAGDAHAESLYFLSQLLEATNRSERARQARGTLRSRYPASRWAKR